MNQHEPQSHYMIGCMSGTSLDGIDLAYVKFTYDHSWGFEILLAETYDYPLHWRKNLATAIDSSPAEINKLNHDYTHFLGGQIRNFIKKHKIKTIDAIASHGHTIFHQPEKGLTLQIGNHSDISDIVGWPVVCDFRVQDVALGGQGAPLVPMGDLMLFSQYQACLNLGGFSNLSLFQNGKVLAFDICAVNTVLNFLSNCKNFPYDAGGEMARRGEFVSSFFQQLEGVGFYSKQPPKSLGIEWVQESILKIVNDFNQHPIEDLLHTYSLHIAKQIAKYLPNQGAVLVSGGGAYNAFLINQIQKRSHTKIVLPSPVIIEFKEALIFAFLGLLRMQGSINCLASVTGAIHDHSSGKIFLPKSMID